MNFIIVLNTYVLDQMLLKVDHIIFESLPESKVKDLAKIIDEHGSFKIEQHNQIDGYYHKDPKVSVKAESAQVYDALMKAGITCTRGFAILYLEDARLLLSRVQKYLVKRKRQAKLISEAIALKDQIRVSKDIELRVKADQRLQVIIKELESEQP